MADPIELRPYQADCVDALRRSYAAGRRAPLLALPTGGGKTIIFSAVTAGARGKARRVLVTAHRRELIRQASEKLTAAGVPHGIICPGFREAPRELVQVASVQTVARRLDRVGAFDLIILDEAHHAVAGQWRALLAAQPAAKILGVTATPARMDGKGLGIEAGGPFDDIVVGPSVAELIAGGYLSPVKVFAPAHRLDLRAVRIRGGDYAVADLERAMGEARITGDAVEHYRQHADHLPAIAFCVSVKHASEVAQQFQQGGYRAACVHGGTEPAERDAAILGLGSGKVEVLTSADLISEGLDVPAVSAVILLRPTKSIVLYMQQVGRGMRPAPGKAALTVLDHVGNTLVHGLPAAERAWSLGGVDKTASRPPVRTCPECSAVNGIVAPACCECGFEFPRTARPRELSVGSGRLAELTEERLREIESIPYREVAAAGLSETELRAYASARGYKPGWVFYRLRERQRHAGTRAA